MTLICFQPGAEGDQGTEKKKKKKNKKKNAADNSLVSQLTL